jgi:hypothetical protein
MNDTIRIQEDQNKYRVFDGELQLACFSSKTAAEDYLTQSRQDARNLSFEKLSAFATMR